MGFAKNICGDRQIVSKDGDKCDDCFPFTRAQRGGKVCAADRCVGGVIKFDGTCNHCPPGTGPDDWGRNCVAPEEAEPINLRAITNTSSDLVQMESTKSDSTRSIIIEVILASFVVILIALCIHKVR